jgi:2-keto-4-pentenoate hydratase/2-oxohepta-3-ene-1,7-dioic acid hydratase in catechol pathway
VEAVLVRLVTFRTPGGERPGAVVPAPDGDRLLDLTDVLAGAAPPAAGATVTDVLADPGLLAAARDAVGRADAAALPHLAGADLAAPVRPGKLLCLGYNYRGHVAAGASLDDVPEHPDVFVKTPNALAGPHDPVVLPPASAHTDYEGEIAVVVGARAKDVPLERAAEHVAGWTLLNDVSSRDWQDRSSQWELGKCFDGFAPLGPWVVTPDEVPDPDDLLLEVERDGVVTVSQRTSTTVFPVPYLVHYLSQVMTLEPGDVISTGTPQKLPAALAAHRPLADGDAVTVRVAGLGELTTRFVDPPAPEGASAAAPTSTTSMTEGLR